jgi:hypothetical protein
MDGTSFLWLESRWWRVRNGLSVSRRDAGSAAHRRGERPEDHRVIGGVESGWLSAASCECGAGETSSVNFPAGSAVANVAVIEVGPSRMTCGYTSTSVHVIVDHIATMS